LSRGERRVIDPHFQALGTAGQSGSLNDSAHRSPGVAARRSGRAGSAVIASMDTSEVGPTCIMQVVSRDTTGARAGGPIGRPSSGGRKFFIEIFENRESFPNANVAIFKRRDLARGRDRRDSLKWGR
jgi:hypothetical protein